MSAGVALGGEDDDVNDEDEEDDVEVGIGVAEGDGSGGVGAVLGGGDAVPEPPSALLLDEAAKLGFAPARQDELLTGSGAGMGRGTGATGVGGTTRGDVGAEVVLMSSNRIT